MFKRYQSKHRQTPGRHRAESAGPKHRLDADLVNEPFVRTRRLGSVALAFGSILVGNSKEANPKHRLNAEPIVEAPAKKERRFIGTKRLGAIVLAFVGVATVIGGESSEAAKSDTVMIGAASTEEIQCTPHGMQEITVDRSKAPDYKAIMSEIITVGTGCYDEAKTIADWQLEGLDGVQGYINDEQNVLRMPEYLVPNTMTLDQMILAPSQN